MSRIQRQVSEETWEGAENLAEEASHLVVDLRPGQEAKSTPKRFRLLSVMTPEAMKLFPSGDSPFAMATPTLYGAANDLFVVESQALDLHRRADHYVSIGYGH